MEEREGENQQQQQLIGEDPYGPSYPDSAIKYLPYRIGITVFAIILIVLGKTNLPSDAVPCIQDVVIDWLQPVTDFYIAHSSFGLFLVSLMQLIVDIQLVGMLTYWFLKGNSCRYPLVLSAIGIAKILLNVLFETRPIPSSFIERAFPSLVFGSNFENTYFFSGVVCLLMAVLLELYELGYYRLCVVQAILLVYVSFLLLSARQNFFMDITTGLVFTHYVYYFIHDRIKIIDGAIISLYNRFTDPHVTTRQKDGKQMR